MTRRLCICALILIALSIATPLHAAGDVVRYEARDTLNIGPEASAEAAKLLKALAWEPADFTVSVRQGVKAVGTPLQSDADALVTFDSPRPRGRQGAATQQVDRVVLEWYQAQSPAGGAGEAVAVSAKAPAVLILHMLDGTLIVERGIARTYAKAGIHAFVMHMPSYGARPMDRSRLSGTLFFELCMQAVADARRARDAIAALPRVDDGRISVQGTSLGGFIAASTASVDAVFDKTFVLLAGGNLYEMFNNGQRETRLIRQRMAQAGVSDAQLRELCRSMELTLVAHRLVPDRTWFINAQSDQVIPAANARALAAAAKVDPSHHIWLSGDHYTVILHLPWVMQQVTAKVLEKALPQAATE